MNTSIQNPEPNGIVQPSPESSKSKGPLSVWQRESGRFTFAAVLAGLLFLLFSAPSARAHESPIGCTGSGLGILLFTDTSNVHIGDTICYSATVFNGLNAGIIVCDATAIQAFIVTPDGVSHPIALSRTSLASGQSDYYPNVVCYVVRAQDVLSDGTVRATASDTGVIHQNDSNSQGGGFQGVNTEVSLPCIRIAVQCVGSVGENGAIIFTGTVTNCGNTALVGVTVVSSVNGGQFPVTFVTSLDTNQAASFSGSWIPLNPCSPSTATFTAQGVDQVATQPQTVTSSASTTCSEVLTPGIKVTKSCPDQPVSPGQTLTFSGSVSNTGNVTLTNIVVVNNQPALNTPVFTLASLAPGAVATFTGSYLAPVSCSVADTLTATAASLCGVGVSSVASATCPILTSPQIAVTAVCPTAPILSGGSVTYSGTVQNTGNITLTNVVVVSDRPAANTTVLTVASLAPGASRTFTGIYTVPANACSITTTFSGRGKDICTSILVTNTVSTTCTVATAPAIGVTLACPAVPASAGGSITYTGTVTNSGNVTLNNVTVVNSQSGTVLTVPSLASHARTNFTASFIAPTDGCSVSSTVTATGSDCTGTLVSNTKSATCPLTATPKIVVTQLCPVSPAIPGGLLTYSGTVQNTGNITLTNVVVLNNLSGATPVFTADTLAPGAVANFNGSYVAPTNCSSTSTSTATGRSVCGVAVINTASVTCPILTAPQIAVTAACPTAPVLPGGSLTYSGTVQNTGNITLTNVVVVSDRPAANTTVLTVASLAPGASRTFTGIYTVPANAACAVTTTFSGSGKDICTLNAVTNTVSTTCTVTTAPAIAVTLACPVVPVVNGGLITYTGTVRNSGNVTLNNVVVVNSQSVPSTVFTVPSLAPGASANFTASFTASTDGCSVSSTVTASGNDNCTQAMVTSTASATCPLIATPKIVVTQLCPVSPAIPGGLLTYSGTVQNTGNITLTNVVVLNNLSGATPVFTADTLAPGAVANFNGSYVAPTNCSSTSTSTATGRSVCGVAVINTASVTCPILTAPQIAVTAVCPTAPVLPGGSLTYSGTVQNTGNITLTNVVVVSDQPAPNTTVFTVASLAPGASANFTGAYTVPANACTVTTTFSGTGKDVCTFSTVTNTVSTTCTVTTAPAIAVTLACPAVSASAGGLITYTGTVRNSGNVTLNNVVVVNSQSVPSTVFTVPSLAPGASANFTASFTTSIDGCSVSSTVTASGNDNCTQALVSNSASVTCPLITTPGIKVTKVCPAQPVSPGQTLTFSGSVSNTGNVTLTGIVVVNNQPALNTRVFTADTLAPGEVANFTGSYVVPINIGLVPICSVTDTLTATAASRCGVGVSSVATATCPILTVPAIVVTQTCPITSVLPGGLLTYSGTVSNAGNITLTNIIVVDNRPATNTVIFTRATLAPGATANFTGSYQVPLDCCVVWSTVRASGQGCDGVTVTDTDTRTCTVLTLPRIVVTKLCAPGVLRPGDLLTYSGSVSNAGNITLINVTVVDNQPANNTTVIGPITLAPGESVNYNGSYIVPPDFCGSDTVTASGLDVCTYLPVVSSVTATCPVTTTPRITVTKNCPAQPTPRGGLYIYTGSVSNAGNVTLVNVFVTDNYKFDCYSLTNSPVIGPITLAPGASVNFSGRYTAPWSCCEVIDTLTARGQDRCSGSNVTATATTVCPLITTPSIAVVQNCPPNPIPMGSLYVFSGYVTNTGDTTLTNVFVFGPQGTRTPVLGPIELAPGESEIYSGSYTVPFNTCSVSVTAIGQGICGGNVVANTAGCPVATTPQIAATLDCPAVPAITGGLIIYTGTVRNSGNVTLNNVFVMNNQPAPNPSVIDPLTITVTNGMVAVSWTATPGVTYALQYKSNLLDSVWKDIAGYVIASGGTASKEDFLGFGQQRFYRVRIVSDSPVTGPLTLAPGESANFTASFTAPIDACSVSSTVIVTGSDNCTAVVVTNTASATCPLTTTPGIKVIKVCPPQRVSPGQTLTFSGTVINTGNVTLNNIVVFNDQPAANTVVFTVASLAPGAFTNFTGSYVAPVATSVTDTLTATATSHCGGAVTNTASATCSILIIPAITITESCPPGPVPAGSLVVFGGSVCNAGNITLTNVFVFSGQPSNVLVLGPITLAPGACQSFTGSYLTTGGSNPTTNTTIVPQYSPVITTNVVSLITTNNPGTVITTNNPGTVTTNASPTWFATINPLLGTATNRFIVPNTLNGLTFAPEDHGYAATEFYSIRTDTSGTSFFDTITASTATTTDRFNVPTIPNPNQTFDAVTYATDDLGYGAKIFYYLSHDTAGVETFGTITPGGVVGLSAPLFVVGTKFDVLTYTATDVGYGANMFYYIRHDATGVSTFGTINPTPGGIIQDRFTLRGTNFVGLVFTTDIAPGYGANNFYYLRQVANGVSWFGTILLTPPSPPNSATETDRFIVGNNATELTYTFPPQDVAFGPTLFYFLRGGGLSLTTNNVTTFITNSVTTYATNTVITGYQTNNVITGYTTNSVVLFTPTNTVTAFGVDILLVSNVTASANCIGPVAPAVVPAVALVIGTPRMAINGSFSLAFPTEKGKSYTVQYKNTLNDPWTNLPGMPVSGTGGDLIITDPTAAGQPSRFYRVTSP
jgi:uncharacterized repeat protein (TIGR01451 family)